MLLQWCCGVLQGARLAFYSEENDVLERDSNADMRLQQATCDELKNILLKIKGKKRRTSSSRKVSGTSSTLTVITEVVRTIIIIR